jgi:PRP38 family
VILFAPVVPRRENHSITDLRSALLERTLFRIDRWGMAHTADPKLSVSNHYAQNYPAETIIDKAIELNSIGGVYGNQKPTNFVCLLLKLLQIQPEKEILVEYLLVDEFKCVLS